MGLWHSASTFNHAKFLLEMGLERLWLNQSGRQRLLDCDFDLNKSEILCNLILFGIWTWMRSVILCWIRNDTVDSRITADCIWQLETAFVCHSDSASHRLHLKSNVAI